jgi:enamine deaminase RidA (YjgF/YER057c/UK114 family)
MTPAQRMHELGLELPAASTPVGVYRPARRCGGLIFTSGQLPIRSGQLTAKGKVPQDVPLEAARAAARLTTLNALAAAAQCAGGIDALSGVVRVGVFVNSSPGFVDQPQVANGASELLVQIFGDDGQHARAAVGVAELPLDACVEIELLVTAAL